MNVDDGVVLAVIQITDDLAPNGRHLRVQHTYGWEDVSSFLIQQGKERLMEIQQHDGVVMDVAGLGRASPSFCERERCSRGGGRRPRLLYYCPPSPLYIGPLGGGRRPGTHLDGGAAARGVTYPPSQVGRPPP